MGVTTAIYGHQQQVRRIPGGGNPTRGLPCQQLPRIFDDDTIYDGRVDLLDSAGRERVLSADERAALQSQRAMAAGLCETCGLFQTCLESAAREVPRKGAGGIRAGMHVRQLRKVRKDLGIQPGATDAEFTDAWTAAGPDGIMSAWRTVLTTTAKVCATRYGTTSPDTDPAGPPQPVSMPDLLDSLEQAAADTSGKPGQQVNLTGSQLTHFRTELGIPAEATGEAFTDAWGTLTVSAILNAWHHAQAADPAAKPDIADCQDSDGTPLSGEQLTLFPCTETTPSHRKRGVVEPDSGFRAGIDPRTDTALRVPLPLFVCAPPSPSPHNLPRRRVHAA